MEDPLGRGTLHGLSCAEPRLPRVVQCSTRERTRVSHGRDESPGPPTSFLSALIRVVQGDAQTLRPIQEECPCNGVPGQVFAPTYRPRRSS